MKDQTRVTTDPEELAVRALELLAGLRYVVLSKPPDPWDADKARRLFRDDVSTGRSIQYRARSAWHGAQQRQPRLASLVALAEFAYARAIDALVGDSSKLVAWLTSEEVGSSVLAGEAARLAPLAKEFAATARDLAGFLPRVAQLEAHLTQTAAATHVAEDQAELHRALSPWCAAREACISAERLAAEVLFDGAGLPAERRQLAPAPLWPEDDQRHQQRRAAIVYSDLCRLGDAGTSVEDLTFIAYGRHTEQLENRIWIQMRRARTGTPKTLGPEM